ncbi:MAG: DUF1499 domain-containing protein [Chamaesiphon sp.]|nr:DUF1499 domain-containing protein [Chamaesiphon sp.]
MDTVKSNKFGKYIVIAIGLVITFLLVNNHVFAGISPTNIGVNNGKLAICPNTPNCVNSQAIVSDTEHSIKSIQIGQGIPQSMADLKLAIKSMPRSTIIKETNNYLYVEFTSKLMGFVDDVEFYFDDDGKSIQVRSASRLGESDLGVNRQRIEEIRSKLISLN